MPDQIIDGTGSGKRVKVGSDNRMRVYAKAGSLQHSVSEDDQQAYQVICLADISDTAGNTPVMHFKNNSTTNNAIVTYLRHQVVDAAGGTAFPSVESYFSVGGKRCLDFR